ncbi:MAG: hypothetical protein JJLCMIEE_00899 [Acidimicrobiales bacterium]|nr:MAG: inner-membrane translocator [Actinomycetota bacterium]MBV6507841.1 hypothetical protein [Acidimicrobiales bacterium]RIK05991.1 MAG: inner-membrane translocator [Acidobacteriota bacterium]
MENLSGFLILGIATGSLYAIAASGLVVTYTTSGIFNFAHGATGMVMAYIYWQITDPEGWGVHPILGLVVVLFIVAPLFGALVERVIMRGLQDTSLVTKLVVTIGLMVGLRELVNQVLWPPAVRPAAKFFPGDRWTLSGVSVTAHDLIGIAVAILVAAGLYLLLYKTRIGVSMRAVVDDRELVRLNGGRPNRLSMFSWGLGASLAALAGILAAPIVQSTLQVDPLTIFVINAYAAAVIGRLQSLPWTFAGGIIIGVAQNLAVVYLPQTEALTGLRPSVPTILLFITLLVLPQTRLRTHSLQRLRESVPHSTLQGTLLMTAVLMAAVALVAQVSDARMVLDLSRALVLCIMILSLVPLTGFAGQISLAQWTFGGIGVWVAATWISSSNPLSLVLAALVAGAVGAVVALPALRLQGIYLALATMAFAVLMDNLVFKQEWMLGSSIVVDRLPGLENDKVFAIFLALMFGLLALFVVWLRRGPFGRRLQAMKDSPAACATLGLDLTRTKLEAFAISAAIAGIGGVMLGMLKPSVGPNDFLMFNSLPLLLMGVVGGITAVGGALFGGLLLGAFPVLARVLADVPVLPELFLLGPALAGISLGRNPNGAVNEITRSFRDRNEARRRRKELREVADVRPEGDGVAIGPEAPAHAGDGRVLIDPLDEPEWLGIDRPFTQREVQALNEALDLKESDLDVTARS